MTNTRAVGNRRERQARDIYDAAGYAVQPFYGRSYGETDGFGLADFLAIRKSPASVVIAQVKSGYGAIGDWFQHADALLPPTVEAHYLSVFKREGWRLCVRGDDEAYRVAYDERDADCRMGVGLREWLADD